MQTIIINTNHCELLQNKDNDFNKQQGKCEEGIFN